MKKLDNKGSAAILLSIFMVVLLGFTALVVDIGMVYAERTKLSNAIDSAVLAATLELPNHPEEAKAVALEYLEKNNVDTEDTEIIIGEDHRSIEITGLKEVKHFFAPVLGILSSDTGAATKAVIGPASSVSEGVRPFAVEKFPFEYGDEVILKAGAGDGYHGNYGAAALGGTGASRFKDNSLFGYEGTISVGDFIDTEPGNMAGATSAIRNYINEESSSFDNFERDSKRLWTIPLVDDVEPEGRDELLVVGFGQFYVEDVANAGGHTEITGRFVEFVTNATIDQDLDNTGTYGAKLTR
ncbi:TadE/TadG family type IV pilus assembly protein [Isachenkonia alkalipeptolytica]|uniref:Putative Flp pilus-assembly TadG-like N-terminal domain-containing protein n=1 Tax=Isachenkonia alkalipeptolytica TaxID=2565777 RepID=A0AA43XKF9_9CLOT|nr:Tad domain-containing protein [Isachenkonia alkalipeptolytica]NBG87949.1 hypothetical protein [Isachenkonia alkalipeptolytica]